MTYAVQKLSPSAFPPLLREIPEPPEELWVAGTLPDPSAYIYLTVVGSRKHTSYGREVCASLIAGLSNYPVAIVSGLALGIDGIAHEAAMKAGLPTVAVPGSGLSPSVLYPRSHFGLAERIIDAGGALLSEYPPDFRATQWSFPKRNRIMAGMAQATLLIEAGEKSGTLITARLASDYNRELLVVPGSIFSEQSRGTHQFLKLGATPVTESADILAALHLEIQRENKEDTPEMLDLALFTPEERAVMEVLTEPLPREVLVARLNIGASRTNILLMKMELAGLIVDSPDGMRRVSY